VTDANLLLGLLGGIAGGIELDGEAAERAVRELGETLGLDTRETAEGIIKVANAEMVRALRVMTVERGVDPRGLALMAFGGAGGLHAAAIAEELGITKILCPRASGVLAALGLVVSERRRDAQRSVLLAPDELGEEADDLAERARAELSPDADVRIVAELRYRGQAFELAVELSDHLEEDFHKAHEEAYGYRDPEAEVELVTLRATATTPGPEIDPAAVGKAAEGAERSRRDTIYGDTEIIRGEPAPGERIDGPAIVELPEATLAVPEGWSGEVLESGTIRIER
jgi:N-methylhydantoinase A